MVREHNVVSARLRLGYQQVWQVSQVDVPHYSSCKSCNHSNANTLHHYCLQCPTLTHLLPHGQNLIHICTYICLQTTTNMHFLLTIHTLVAVDCIYYVSLCECVCVCVCVHACVCVCVCAHVRV